MKILIVDDELLAREELKYLLSKDKRLEIVGDVGSLDDALEIINKREVDLIFLDIQINNENGVEFAEQIKEKEMGVIFATAYDQYAVQAFSLNAIDYLLKPFSEERVLQSIDKAFKKINKKEKPSPFRKLTFWNEEKMVVVAPEEILYLTVEDRKVMIYTTKGILTDNGPLQSTIEKLDPNLFIRTHRSFVVNIEKIEEIIPWFNNTYILKIVGLKNVEIPVSRGYIQEFKKRIGLM
ncbi:two component transcriptional regulator, LytTR family [Anaerobranca californiensis DSM 14826]|uniref:Stage 0 sporulation protein A homolog n=1 Tax=Anaerobranca californiensis DSM 14826 TaxID=1120989 RepID=A0A1M6Q9B4_9FIRM|nr:LytTR family DNA-binding domain-containing protein [Anaerobranca californiensis]SHK16738.1 two component transcriptional regulator, LytTR family [Anaerobranca californiensis DSM 14826]